MTIILSAIYIVGVGIFAREILAWVYIVQLKEYRLDRLQEFVASPEGKKIIVKQITWISIWIAVAIIGLQGNIRIDRNAFNDALRIIPTFTLTCAVIITAITTIHQLQNKKLRLPTITSRSIATTASAFIISICALYIAGKEAILNLEVTIIGLIALAPLFVGIATVLSSPLSYLLKRRIIQAAIEKRAGMKNLLVIGVTGSYGKTSVKEYLYAVLNGSFNVLKTSEHVNTEIGVAHTVNNFLTDEHQIFIVEMGAYKVGEIAAICNIVKPKTGIITGVGNQHVALFGTVQNIVDAKAELADSLPENGTLILNKDNKWCRIIGDRHENLKKKWYTFGSDADIEVQQIHPTAEKTTFSIKYKNKKLTFATKLIGEHVVQNLLPVIQIALDLGIPYKTIYRRIAKLKPLKENMQKIEKPEMTIIDNTYNLNVAAVKAANKTAKLFEHHNKVVILDDILELGRESTKSHQEVARYLNEFNVIYLVGKNYAEIVEKELRKIGSKSVEVKRTRDSAKILEDINQMHVQKVVFVLGRSGRKLVKSLHE